MGNFITSLSEPDDMSQRRTLSAYHRHYQEHPDGSKTILEKSVEHLDSVYARGDGWLNTNQQGWKDKDREQDHFRSDKKSTIVKETTTIIDKDGRKTIDEKGKKTEEDWSSRGKKLIGIRPEVLFDERANLLDDFSSNKNAFQIGEKKNFIPLWLEDNRA